MVTEGLWHKLAIKEIDPYRCIGCEDVGGRLIQYPFFRREIAKIHKSLRLADAVVSNSEYTRRTFRSILGLDSQVLTPPIEQVKSTCHLRESGSILFVSPVKHKGLDIAVELARRLNNEKFVFVGRANKSIARMLDRLDNVDYVPWAEDMDSYYSASKLVIVPSVIPEGYGRVCSEALARGVPCAVSAVGALPEVLGDAGDVVINHRDVNSWVAVVRKYSDPEYVRQKSAEALRRAAEFTSHEQYAVNMESLIQRCVAMRRKTPARDIVNHA